MRVAVVVTCCAPACLGALAPVAGGDAVGWLSGCVHGGPCRQAGMQRAVFCSIVRACLLDDAALVLQDLVGWRSMGGC